jgi:hypothetical protein
MRILFAGKQHFDPGGIPASVDDLARRLTSQGHSVGVVAHRAFDGPPAELRLALCPEPAAGYDAWSADLLTPAAALGLAVRTFAPEVLVVNAGGWWWHDWTIPLVAAAPARLPTVVHVRDQGAVALLADGIVEPDRVLANAHVHVAALTAAGIGATFAPSLVELDESRPWSTSTRIPRRASRSCWRWPPPAPRSRSSSRSPGASPAPPGRRSPSAPGTCGT